MTFDEAVLKLAKEDGTDDVITQIPGVWEEVSEYYNNEALKRVSSDVDQEIWDETILKLAREDGTDFVVTRIPGVWEEVSEYYNNAAIDLMEMRDKRTSTQLKQKLLR